MITSVGTPPLKSFITSPTPAGKYGSAGAAIAGAAAGWAGAAVAEPAAVFWAVSARLEPLKTSAAAMAVNVAARKILCRALIFVSFRILCVVGFRPASTYTRLAALQMLPMHRLAAPFFRDGCPGQIGRIGFCPRHFLRDDQPDVCYLISNTEPCNLKPVCHP
jgi:hypothetical protein